MPLELTDGSASNAVGALLSEYSGLVRQRIAEHLSDDLPNPLEPLLMDYPQRGGKGLRPALLIATAQVFGGSLDVALPAAVALEILHNAQLVHDDIEDGSLTRRTEPALHQLSGLPLALCVGDALAFRSLRPLLESRHILGDRLTLQLFEESGLMMHELVAGQALDLGWRDRNVIRLDESNYLEMVLKKTCWLSTIYPLRAGALIGSRGGIDPGRFIRFGFFLGAVFQIQDDLLNLTGVDTRYGKEPNGDLWEGKRTLILIYLFERCNREERQRLRSIYGKKREHRNAAEIAWVRQRIEAYDCLEEARGFAHGLAVSALTECEALIANRPSSRDRDMIEGLVHWALGRSR